jgi:hypothetical protein
MMTSGEQPTHVAGLQATEVYADNLVLASALQAIIGESGDAEVVRVAYAALTSTETGRRYISANPARF